VNAQDPTAEPTPDLQLEIAYILLIDLVGYSKLLVNEQVKLLQRLKEIVRSTESFRAAEARGELIRVPTGDGMALVFFHSPEEPARCALEISKELQDHPSIRLRMGVHSGPVNRVIDVNEKTNIAGSGINVAQRVQDCGDAGHILLSAHVAEDLAEYRHWQPHLHDLGECEVKVGLHLHLFNLYKDGLGNPQVPEKLRRGKRKQAPAVSIPPVTAPRWPKPVLLLAMLGSAVTLAVSLSTFFHRASPTKSIAVLPFENLSRDPNNAYFVDGVQAEILTNLARIADLKVISRTSVMQYKSGIARNLSKIGHELGVANVVEGSVQRSGDRVRVNAQLVDARTHRQLWAQTYDRGLADVFAIQSEIAKGIVESLQAKLTGQEEQVIAAKFTDNVEAYDAYLRGLVYTLKTSVTPANSLGGQKYLREAVRLDPKFALGWALLSYVNSVGYLSTTLQPTVALREEARQAAETALSLRPNLGEAVLAKGYYHYACLKDYGTAVGYFEEARQFLPNDSRIPKFLAYVARRRGQWDQSESLFNEAERLDPRNVDLLTQHSICYTALRRFPEALRKLEQVLNITPNDVDTLAQKAGIAQAQGDLPRAAALLAPLRPAADLTYALETQVYQGILERRPAPIIPRLKEILANPNPALGYLNGELRFWLGWAQEVAGDHGAAQETWRQARSELESLLKEQPENFVLIGDLALTSMGLRDRAAALALAERAIAANPIEKDAVFGPMSIEILARVAARTGAPDRAIAALEKLLSIPYNGALAENVPLTPALLRLDPMFDPLRNDPRFQKLCEEKQQ
jgi:TolB-like protein/class 3 adenylate cyclase/Tfp pilus assembly protein PilF